MLSRILYFVPHGEAMSALFRDSRHTVPAPCLLTALVRFFGLPAGDRKKFKEQMIPPRAAGGANAAIATDPSRYIMEKHRSDFRVYLQGGNLGAILSRITDAFAASISSDPRISAAADAEWVELPDLHDFMARRVFGAVTDVVFDEAFARVCPTLYEDFWAFYEVLPLLLLGIPRWMLPSIWAARDKMHHNFIVWRRWCEAQTPGGAAGAPAGDGGGGGDDIFDPVWGTAMTRRLSKIYEGLGFSDKGVAAAMLSYFSV